MNKAVRGREKRRVLHELSPVYDEHSRVLILGSIPSPKSREAGFYYAHPQNRFWRVMSAVFGKPFPETTAQRRAFALSSGFALWDVLYSCEILSLGCVFWCYRCGTTAFGVNPALHGNTAIGIFIDNRIIETIREHIVPQ